MNWGTKIVIGLGTCMLCIVGAGIYMVTNDHDSLVDEDYYEKSLAYDEVYDRKQNLLSDHAKPFLELRNDTLRVTFTTIGNRGKFHFKRPSDGSLDKTIPFFTASKQFLLSSASFSKGNWSVEISWGSGGKNYVDNQSLFIQ